MKYRTYLTPFPPSTEPIIPGMTTAEWKEAERKEKERFARGETKEITEEQFKGMAGDEVLMGIQLPDSVDDWLRNHLFTMGDRPNPKASGEGREV